MLLRKLGQFRWQPLDFAVVVEHDGVLADAFDDGTTLTMLMNKVIGGVGRFEALQAAQEFEVVLLDTVLCHAVRLDVQALTIHDKIVSWGITEVRVARARSWLVH